MSAAPQMPDVLVLGMPSSGKTVFLSVLGNNFALTAEEDEARPLGFRLWAKGRSTIEAVRSNYAKILGGSWPHSTVSGKMIPLTWDVYTGKRNLFSLTSMDVSGETFKLAFGKESERQAAPKTGGAGASQDGMLDMASGGAAASGKDGTVESEAADLLRKWVPSAKVVCFFINIAGIYDGRTRVARRIAAEKRIGAKGEKGDKKEEAVLNAIENFEGGVANICSLLEEVPELRKTALIVLTQAHSRKSEIETAGGPAAFLGSIAPDLRIAVAEYSIPVIAVSAVNEEEENAAPYDMPDEEDGLNLVPETIVSEGLFGFLLAVGGAVVKGPLGEVRARYLDFIMARARRERLQKSVVPERLALSEALKNAGLAFCGACRAYLGDRRNFMSPGDSYSALPPAVVEQYSYFTFADPELKDAKEGWEFPLARDVTWNRVFARYAVDAASGREAEIQFGEFAAKVRRNLASVKAAYAELHDDSVYGIGSSGSAAAQQEWVRANCERYCRDMEKDLQNIDRLLAECKNKAEEEAPANESSFLALQKAVRTAFDACEKGLSNFRSKWMMKPGEPLPYRANAGLMLDGFKQSWKDSIARRAALKEELVRKAAEIARVQELQRQAAARKSRRNRLIALLCIIVAHAGVILAVYRQSAVSWNDGRIKLMQNEFAASRFAEAAAICGELREIPLLGVKRSRWISRQTESLILEAAGLIGSKPELKTAYDELDRKCRSFVNEGFATSRRLNDKRGAAYREFKSCCDALDDITFEAVSSGTVEFETVARKIDGCRAAIAEASSLADKELEEQRNKRKKEKEAERARAFAREAEGVERRIGGTVGGADDLENLKADVEMLARKAVRPDEKGRVDNMREELGKIGGAIAAVEELLRVKDSVYESNKTFEDRLASFKKEGFSLSPAQERQVQKAKDAFAAFSKAMESVTYKAVASGDVSSADLEAKAEACSKLAADADSLVADEMKSQTEERKRQRQAVEEKRKAEVKKQVTAMFDSAKEAVMKIETESTSLIDSGRSVSAKLAGLVRDAHQKLDAAETEILVNSEIEWGGMPAEIARRKNVLPAIVQVDVYRKSASGKEYLDVEPEGSDGDIAGGASAETGKRCIYIKPGRDDVGQLNRKIRARLVQGGKTLNLFIPLDSRKPGVTRIEKILVQ